jgi:Zn-dependent M28 family amino/carboxypeptidase
LNLPDGHKIVADINLDMVSRNDPKKIGVTPSPKHGDHNSLVPAAQASCLAEGMQVVFDADAYYFRTDSYSFASKGIPSIFFFAGVHADYHRPTDDVEKADFEKAARVARAAFRLGWQAAQAPEAPKKIKAETKDKGDKVVTGK